MKNIFKSLLVIIVGMLCTYVVWALGCFLFTGEWLGIITFEQGSVIYFSTTVIVVIWMFAYLDDKTDYYN